MTIIKTIQRSFAGGEISDEMYGRTDDGKYQSGLALCKNFITTPQGPVENRPGFKLVKEVKNSVSKVRLIPFTYSTTQTMIIEMGAGYFRFHHNGGTLTQEGTYFKGGIPYEIYTPFQERDLFEINYVQSADVLTLTSAFYPPMELRRLGAAQWELIEISFSPQLPPPENVTAVASGHTEIKYQYFYLVTAISADLVSESITSAYAEAGGNLFETGATVYITWDAVPGAARYNVYKYESGTYGFIGQTPDQRLVDDNISPDLSKTTPIYEFPFSGEGNYPSAVSYFEQRRCFAGTLLKPQNIWMTKSGTESNMSFSIPTRDDDRISFRVAAREANTIRHIVPLQQLLLLTSAAEWKVTSVNSDAITPSTVSVHPQSYIGASHVQPSIINNTVIYCAARGGHVRELGHSYQSGGFVTGDLSIRSAHLFDDEEILDMAYSKSPKPIVWFVSTNGKLLGMTYVPEQGVGGWHQHETDGHFESCAVVAEGREDYLYCVIRRNINGRDVRFIERMESRQFKDQADAFFVDCGLSYEGEPVQNIAGLSHLEGEIVSILADGAVHPQQKVIDGEITLIAPAKKVHIGLAIIADIKTLPAIIPLNDGSFGQGMFKNVNKIWLRVFRSSGIFAGADENSLVEFKQRKNESAGTPPSLKTEEIEIPIKPSWGDSGQIFIRQLDPLPIKIINITSEICLGG